LGVHQRHIQLFGKSDLAMIFMYTDARMKHLFQNLEMLEKRFP
jgi:hypothetical protein